VEVTDINMNNSALLWSALLIILTGVKTSSLVLGREIPTLSGPSQPTRSQIYTHTLGNLIRPKRTTQLKLCGDQLLNMLSLICGIARDNVKYKDDVEDLGQNSLGVRLSRPSISSLVSSLPPGLTTQCCVRSCTMQQLLPTCWQAYHTNWCIKYLLLTLTEHAPGWCPIPTPSRPGTPGGHSETHWSSDIAL